MRIVTLFGVLVFFQVMAVAQPVRQALSGPNFLAQKDSVQISHNEHDFTFLPENFAAEGESSLLDIPRTKPGVAMLASAILPGSGQAANGKWGRAAAYLLVEAASIWYYFDQDNKAKDNEIAYQQYANQNWSPMAYAKWLVDYSRAHGLNEGLAELNDLEAQVQNLEPNFDDATQDWIPLDISLVRAVEVRTPFILEDGTYKSEFSHVLQDYGSQQYYELMSKYYQFQPGWQDFYETKSNPNGIYYGYGDNHIPYGYTWNYTMITGNFAEGRDRAFEFNENYRRAGNILTLVMVNHVVSAFDAYFTVKLKNSRIETSTARLHEGALSVTWHF